MMEVVDIVLSGEENGLKWHVDGQGGIGFSGVSLGFVAASHGKSTSVVVPNLPDAFWTDMRSAAKLLRKRDGS